MEKEKNETPINFETARRHGHYLPRALQKTISFKHGANMGDLLYSLVSMKKAAEQAQAKVAIYQDLYRETQYYGAQHPLGTYMFTDAMFEAAAPIIRALPYVASFEKWNGERVDFNIDNIRDETVTKMLGLPHGDIRQWVMMYFPSLQTCIGEPWLTGLPTPKEKQADLIVVNRTARYRNPIIDYSFLNDLPNPIFFIGVLDEYREFMQYVRKAEFYPTKNYLQIAGLLQYCGLFIGNQSSCFAVAEGLGIPRVLEVCPIAPNVIPATPNGYLFRDQICFENLVKQLCN